MAYNYNKLKGRIIEKCGSQKDFAKAEGMTETTLSAKLQSKRFFTQSEIEKAINILDIATSEIGDYFFCK